MTQKELDEKLDQLMGRFDTVNRFFITKIARQIKKIGELNPSSINRLVIMSEMNEDMASINAELQQALQISMQDLVQIYNKALQDTYTAPRFRRALELTPLSDGAKMRLRNYAQNVTLQTAGRMKNLSNTTAIPKQYIKAVDQAVFAVSSGLTDYKSAAREIIREVGFSGLQVEYDSGYHRRLDTALRQNIVDGVKQITQHGSDMMGKELGYDAYELSAHAMSAPDHEPVQGRVFLIEEFEKMQAGLRFEDVDGNVYEGFPRQIGEWNCMHFAMSFSTEHSVRRYSDEQLKQWAEDNARGCVIDGKHYTTYEASRLMRKIETRVRRLKDTAIAAKASGDEELQKECMEKINKLSRKYTEVAKTAGLTPRRDRMMVEGFKAANTGTRDNLNKPVNIEKSLVNNAEDDTIESRNISGRNMSNGLRTSPFYILSDEEMTLIKKDAQALGIPENVLRINEGSQTGFSDLSEVIYVRGDILPDVSSVNVRDLLSSKAVLAHEYYGHFMHHPSNFVVGDWRDEFRASYRAALDAPGLSDEERRMLMLDAYDRAREAGVNVRYNGNARRIIYGYDE